MTALIGGYWPPWLAPIGGEFSGFKYHSGRLYGPAPVNGNGTRVPANATNWYMPFIVPVTNTFTDLQASATAAGTAAICRLGLFADDGTCQPGALLADSGDIAVNIGLLHGTPINVTLLPGLYWLAFNQRASTAAATFQATGSFVLPQIGGLAVTDLNQANAVALKTANGSGDSGAFSSPANLTGQGPVSNVPYVALVSA